MTSITMAKKEEPFKLKEGYIDIDELMKKAGHNDFDVEQAHRDSFVDLRKDIKPQPILLSYGEDWSGHPLCIFGEGDYSVITGISKSKKSFIKSALMALYIGGNSETYFSGFRSHRRDDMYVIDFDTEQSDFHAKRTFDRVRKMVGEHYNFYRPYALRKYLPHERMEIIAHVIEKYGKNIGLIAIDGYADLIKDTNDNVESAELAQQIMSWTDEYQFHITGVLHTNPDGSKMRGHLGSEVGRKAQTVLKVESHPEILSQGKVTHDVSRDQNFGSFEFEINQGLPYKL